MKQKYIGENIRIYRERAELTQQQLADKVGISWEMVSRYERSESSPHRTLNRLSNALNVSKSQLLEKHIPERYNYMEYKVPLFLQLPQSNRFNSNYTNYYYTCPEWIFKKDRECIAIDTSLIESSHNTLGMNGIVYISRQVKPEKDDLVLVKEENGLKTKKYCKGNINVLGKILAQEVRY